MFVKVCGIGKQAHAAAAVEAGADAIGFVFHGNSPRNIAPQRAAAIAATVHGAKRVAVMMHPSNDDWRAVLASFNPDVLQTDAEDFAVLDVPASIERWPVYREGGRSPQVPDGPYIYEGSKSGRGETVDWARAAEFARRGSMILAGGLHAGNVGDAVATVQPFGVDVSSGVESAPGEKDPELIRWFIEAAKAAGKKA